MKPHTDVFVSGPVYSYRSLSVTTWSYFTLQRAESDCSDFTVWHLVVVNVGDQKFAKYLFL